MFCCTKIKLDIRIKHNGVNTDSFIDIKIDKNPSISEYANLDLAKIQYKQFSN